jgi:signal transduction histidine kinase
VSDQAGWADTGLEPLRRAVPVAAGLTAVGAIASDPAGPLAAAVALASVVPFVLWAFVWWRMPTVVLVLTTSAAQFLALRNGEMEPLLFMMCQCSTVVGGWEPSTRMVVVAGGLAVATPPALELVFPDGILYGVWVMGILISLLLPRAFRWQLSLVTQLATAREELARQAALDEKRAIARDVHDLVGHGLAAVLLHVTGARHVLRRDPDAAEEALVEAEAVGRRSLQELRRTIGVLRSTDVAGPTTGDDGPTAAPLPRIDELDAVVASVRAAGIDVALRTDGDLGRVDPIVGLSLHRVAEEALANARQHAPAAVTDVAVRVDDDAVVMTVDSIGPLREPDPADADRPRYGLVGMRERMAAVGGDLAAGPTTFGWQVRCRVPLDLPAQPSDVTEAAG